MRKLLILGSVMAGLCPSYLSAQDADDDDEPIILYHGPAEEDITVLASANRTSVNILGQPVSVIGESEIAQIQGGDFTRIAERLPGATVNRSGGVGALTSLSVRGSEPNHLLVLVDGIRVADVASPGGSFDFGTTLPAGIGKIELLRSANSTIWGSQALAGVLAIQPSQYEGGKAALEYGGPDSWYGDASFNRPWGDFTYSLGGAMLESAGISAAASGTEPDGVRQWQVGGRIGAALGRRWQLSLSAGHLDARLEIDGFPAPDFVLADTDEVQDTSRSDLAARIAFQGDDVQLVASYSLSETRREYFDPALGDTPTFTTSGLGQHAEMRGFARVADPIHVHFGAERDWSRFETLFAPGQDSSAYAGYVQAGWEDGGVGIDVGVRHDRHDRFGGEWSLGASGSAWLGSGWRLRAAYGEGYRAPSLFQLLSDLGNEHLRPERSRSFDIGLEQGDRNDPWHFAISLFRRDSEDLIAFVSCFGTSEGICADRPFGTYDNVGRTRAQGIELEAAVRPSERVRFQGVWSFAEATDRTKGSANKGNYLARRPRHALTLSAEWDAPFANLYLGADLRVVSGSFDDAANLVALAGYAVGTIRTSIPLTDELEVFGRVENISDERYQTAAGYGSPGRSAYLGARARW